MIAEIIVTIYGLLGVWKLIELLWKLIDKCEEKQSNLKTKWKPKQRTIKEFEKKDDN